MNPFDLRGPPFLLFYVFATVIGWMYLYLMSRGAFSGSAQIPSADARRHLRDPYLLSFLRGGVREALQTVAFSLNKRRLLSSAGSSLIATRSQEAFHAVKHPLERAFLSFCVSSQPVMTVLQSSQLENAVNHYVEPLRQSGLIADDAELKRRLPAFLLVAGTLLALSVIKIYIALHRGHSNVVFLVMLTAVALLVAHFICRRPRTAAGARALSDQQTLFKRLKGRVGRMSVDGATEEAVLVAAAFGLAELPAATYPFAARLKRQVASGASNTSSSTSSCGSSCGSSGGSSCGGGGGGCGGCGS